ncbi:methyl-accepting chemotaxis protein [Bacillus testis]|uniref:methyl-accepting chemotaxis protein n=1 Tax=Bacillus testis TaxID=1622072 RepID=UPI001E40D304
MDLVNKTTKQSHHSRDLATEGQSRLKELTEKILALSAHTNDVEQAIESLNMSLEQIGGFVGTVQDIADQTNLLSLNSAIEAARAGEHGRGFAVVADEVRKLADQTKKSISEIYSIVQTSTNYMNEVISSISKVQDVIQAGEKESAQTQMSFNNIIASMDDSLEGNHTIQQQIINVISLIDEVEQSMMTVAGQAETLNSTATSL